MPIKCTAEYTDIDGCRYIARVTEDKIEICDAEDDCIIFIFSDLGMTKHYDDMCMFLMNKDLVLIGNTNGEIIQSYTYEEFLEAYVNCVFD